MMKYDFNIKKMKGKVQINVENWISPDSSTVELHRLSGRAHVTFITVATYVDENISIKKGDIILLSKVACDIATSPTSPYSIDYQKFYDIPLSQVMGTFRDNRVNLDSLVLSKGYFIFEKIEKNQCTSIDLPDTSATIGKVIKVNDKSHFYKDMIVVIRDNVSTPIRFNSKDYFACEERAVVGVFHDNDMSINRIDIINENILMIPYISSKVLNSNLLYSPEINYEDLDYSSMYNRDLFKVKYSDKSLDGINQGDILLVNRDYTNYVYYNNEKYFVIDGKKWISAKIIERDEA